MGIASNRSSYGYESIWSWYCPIWRFYYPRAPKLTGDAAGIPVAEVISASIPLVIVMGLVTTVTAFIFLMKDLKSGKLKAEKLEDINVVEKKNR